MTIRVLIADDHGILRAGLQAMLSVEPDIDVIGEAGTTEEVLQLAAQFKPDIVLLDISMPDRGGIETTQLLLRQVQGVRVIILTVHEEHEILQGALQAGASGYVVKRAAKSELMNAIHSVMDGDLYVHPSLMRANKTETSARSETLTRRETEILQLIANGYTNNQVAEALKISARTVEFHRANLMSKLQIESRVGLVRYAAEHGLIDLSKMRRE